MLWRLCDVRLAIATAPVMQRSHSSWYRLIAAREFVPCSVACRFHIAALVTGFQFEHVIAQFCLPTALSTPNRERP